MPHIMNLINPAWQLSVQFTRYILLPQTANILENCTFWPSCGWAGSGDSFWPMRCEQNWQAASGQRHFKYGPSEALGLLLTAVVSFSLDSGVMIRQNTTLDDSDGQRAWVRNKPRHCIILPTIQLSSNFLKGMYTEILTFYVNTL